MAISDFLIRIIFIGLPGVIGDQIYQKLKCRASRKDWEDLIGIVIFSLISYALYAAVIGILNVCCSLRVPTPLAALFDIDIQISWWEIGGASIFGVLVAFPAAYIYNNRFWNKIGQMLHVTKKFGDEDIWTLFLELPASAEWVFVRDYKEKLTYYGWLKAYSESEQERELIIMEATVYNDNSEFLYETDALYLARKRDDLSIEIPKTNGDSAEGDKNDKGK